MSSNKCFNEIIKIGSDFSFESNIISSDLIENDNDVIVGVTTKNKAIKFYKFSDDIVIESGSICQNNIKNYQVLDLCLSKKHLCIDSNIIYGVFSCSDGNIRILNKIPIENEVVTNLEQIHIDDSRINRVKILEYRPATVSVTNTGKIIIHDLEKKLPLEVLDKHSDSLTAVTTHPKSPLIAVGEFSGYLMVWDLRIGRYICDFNTNSLEKEAMHQDQVNSLEFNSAGNLLASSSDDGLSAIWDLRKQKIMRCFSYGTDYLCKALFANDDKSLITVSSTSLLTSWSIYENKLCEVKQMEGIKMNTCGFSKDLSKFYFAYQSKTIDFYSNI